jgi:hypothetical protein
MGSVLRPAPFVLVLAAAATLAACGGGSGGSAGGRLPSCVHPVAVIDGDFPPLPPGSVLDRHHREFGRNVVEGYAPGDLEGVRDYVQRELPKQGYELGEGDAEEHEAETDFSGHHITDGHLRLRDIPGCDGAIAIAITY